MTTSENPRDENTVESRGFIATLVGGLVGATIGVLVSIPPAGFFTRDSGLEGVAAFLLILFLGLCVGGALGAGIALKFRNRTRPLLTALLTLPALFIGAYVSLLIATRLAPPSVLELPLLVLASILGLLAARATATAGRSRTEPVRED